MPSITEVPSYTSNPLLQFLVPLLDSHLTEILSFLWQLGQRILGEHISPSDYEILEYDGSLELLDTKGKHAEFIKRERVRFRQNNTIAYTDMAWGAGNPIAEYHCSPGAAVDTYREGHRLRILISLRETKNRGDITEFNIRRTIIDGFIHTTESFQHDVSHPMRLATLHVIFPKERFPQSISVIEQNSTRTTALGPRNQNVLPDGRLEVSYRIRKPRLFESYIMSWNW